MQLSKNFKSEEFACPCCEKDDISPYVVFLLQHLRDILQSPIIITKAGGFRCGPYNQKIGGSLTSFHKDGLAVDCYCKNLQLKGLYENIEQYVSHFFHGIGIDAQRNFIHLDIGPRYARWLYIDEKPHYFF